MTLQHILTLSIDAIAFSFAAMMVVDLVTALLSAWRKSDLPRTPQGMCAKTLTPIFEQTDKETQCPSQTSADILNADTTPETVAIAATTRSTSPKQKKALTLPTSRQKKQSSVKPSTKVAKKPKNASASGQEKNTLLKNKA